MRKIITSYLLLFSFLGACIAQKDSLPINTINAIIGKYTSGEYIKSLILGASKFFSITFSSPLPIETIRNSCGVIHISFAKKKLVTLTLKMQGNTFDNAKGIPPINL